MKKNGRKGKKRLVDYVCIVGVDNIDENTLEQGNSFKKLLLWYSTCYAIKSQQLALIWKFYFEMSLALGTVL